ncbi:MAG: hypothetical protein VW618_12090 [Alphaproteobacteria bacterium]
MENMAIQGFAAGSADYRHIGPAPHALYREGGDFIQHRDKTDLKMRIIISLYFIHGCIFIPEDQY